MIAVCIISVILLFIIFILFSNVHVAVCVDDCVKLKFRLWLFYYKMSLPQKKSYKKKINKKRNSKKEKNTSKTSHIIKNKNVNELKKSFEFILNELIKIIKNLFKYIFIDNLNLNLIVVGKDSSDTAIKYGYIYPLVNQILQALFYYDKINKQSIKLVPGFDKEKTEFNMKLMFHIKAISLLKIFSLFVYDYTKYLKN